MSSTVVFGAFEDGDMLEVGAANNAWQGAMHVWRTLGAKYLGSDAAVAMFPERLWALHEDKRLSEAERLVHVATFDRAYVRRGNILRVADALEAFEPRTDNLMHQAALLRTSYYNGARVVGWRQTTVSENLWEIDDEDEGGSRPFDVDRDALTGPEVA
jgi:hypothetical protein